MTMRPRLLAFATSALVAACVLGAGMAGCFSERAKASGPVGPATGACRIPIGSPIIGATGALVAIQNFTFSPETLHVKAGTTVTWMNCEPETGEAHTSTADAGTWDSPFLTPGEAYARTFGATGRFDYHCIPHPFMKGVVIVE